MAQIDLLKRHKSRYINFLFGCPAAKHKVMSEDAFNSIKNKTKLWFDKYIFGYDLFQFWHKTVLLGISQRENFPMAT